MIGQEVFTAFCNDGEMSPDGDGEILQHDIFAPYQSDALIAEPFLLMPSGIPGQRFLWVSALENILQHALLVKAAACEQTFPVNHDVFQIRTIDQAVGEIGMSVVLDSHIGIDLRFFVIAAFSLLLSVGMDNVRFGGRDHGALLQKKVHIAG